MNSFRLFFVFTILSLWTNVEGKWLKWLRHPEYKITLDYENVCHWDRHFFFKKVAKKWGKTIVKDVPSLQGDFSKFSNTDCGPYPSEIDDLYVCVSYKPFGDGLGGVIASAMPTIYRNNSVAAAGFMRFDEDDISLLKQSKIFRGTILHELGHLLGLNNQVWERLGITGRITDDPPCPYRLDSNATREWQAISGCSEGPPLETSFPGNFGIQCSHWDEDCMGAELMTGTVEGDLILSRVTIGALEDIGYKVDYGTADSYSAGNINPSCLCNSESNVRRSLRQRNQFTSRPKRNLSNDNLQNALSYGQSLLDEFSVSELPSAEGAADLIAGHSVVVFYMDEDGSLRSIIVSS